MGELVQIHSTKMGECKRKTPSHTTGWGRWSRLCKSEGKNARRNTQHDGGNPKNGSGGNAWENPPWWKHEPVCYQNNIQNSEIETHMYFTCTSARHGHIHISYAYESCMYKCYTSHTQGKREVLEWEMVISQDSNTNSYYVPHECLNAPMWEYLLH